ncbi:MAG: DUF4390 domain-containing protein [Halothiobacillaceae bacterium]|jgi:hypothetical protein|nr:DUF4390 domain-containing protein [Halothiobacillaceae bacterium]MDY0049486.1 DUF4390 domain-containing protein [Halothiobacillaceae bacterium]
MKRLMLAFGTLCLLGLPLLGQADILVRQVHIEVREGQLYQDASFTITLNPVHEEALKNGLPLIFVAETELSELRDWMWTRELFSASRQLRLEYHALSEKYLIEDSEGQITDTHASLDSALDALGRIRAWPLLPAERVPSGRHYLGRTRLRLRLDVLPLPLRVPAYLQSDWHLASDWYLWSP